MRRNQIQRLACVHIGQALLHRFIKPGFYIFQIQAVSVLHGIKPIPFIKQFTLGAHIPVSYTHLTGAEFITLIAKTVGIATGDQIIDDTAQDVYDEFLEVILMDSNVDASSQTVNREQAAVIVAGAMLYDKSVNSISEDMFSSFSDFDGTRLNLSLIHILNPDAKISRAEIAAIIVRAIEYAANM